jgi:hypothetical protein
MVHATSPWVRPTDPDVRLKPWKCSRRSSDIPSSCTGVFHGECQQPNPFGIKSHTTVAILDMQCPFDPTINEIQMGRDAYDPEVIKWWMGAATLRTRTHPTLIYFMIGASTWIVTMSVSRKILSLTPPIPVPAWSPALRR